MVGQTRMHYVDEGQGDTILCLHGEPTWSYLYRKMIPKLSSQYRVIAMDFIGFGKSDKFMNKNDYTYSLHAKSLISFIDTLKLTNITLVVHDWGGYIGLYVMSVMPDIFNKLVLLNTNLPTGDKTTNRITKRWLKFVSENQDLPIDKIMRMGVSLNYRLTENVLKAYNAPYPNETYKTGPVTWPLLIPIKYNDLGAAEVRRARLFLSGWEKPTAIIFSDKDPITRGEAKYFQNLIPSAKHQPIITIKNAGHFLQEEKGEEISEHILNFMKI